MPGQSLLQGRFRYVAALLFVACAFGARVGFDSLFGNTTFVYSIFYLAVVLAAYFCEAGAAICASAVSAVLAYWAFSAPTFAFKINPEGLTGMGFFALTSAIDIFFINAMKQALEQYSREHRRAETLAEGNAVMFKEFSERTTHHLQLVAALLQSRADNGVDEAYRHALTEASRRTMAISRAHRALIDDGTALIDFTPFARQLMRASMDAVGLPEREVEILGDAVGMTSERATSIAIVLLESVRALLRCRDRASAEPVRLHLTSDPLFYRLRLTAALPVRGAQDEPLMDDMSHRVANAAIEHIQGRFSFYRGDGCAVFELSVPQNPVPFVDVPLALVGTPSSLLH